MRRNKCTGVGEKRVSIASRNGQALNHLLEGSGVTDPGANPPKLRFVVDAEQEVREGTRVSTTCLSGTGCAANTTMCSIRNLGHFYPGRRKTVSTPAPISALEIITFLLRGACEAGGSGVWKSDSDAFGGSSQHGGGYCSCLDSNTHSGRYCLRAS
jgi:hypothetical protein